MYFTSLVYRKLAHPNVPFSIRIELLVNYTGTDEKEI
jgi:hypothetical protein